MLRIESGLKSGCGMEWLVASMGKMHRFLCDLADEDYCSIRMFSSRGIWFNGWYFIMSFGY